MKIIGSSPSRRIGVAVSPSTLRHFDWFRMPSKETRKYDGIVDDYLSVGGKEIRESLSSPKRLQNGDIEIPVALLFPPPIRPMPGFSIVKNCPSRSFH